MNEKTILVRAIWSDITPDSHKYEETYSNDGVMSWVRSFTAQLTRLKHRSFGAPTVARAYRRRRPALDQNGEYSGGVTPLSRR